MRTVMVQIIVSIRNSDLDISFVSIYYSIHWFCKWEMKAQICLCISGSALPAVCITALFEHCASYIFWRTKKYIGKLVVEKKKNENILSRTMNGYACFCGDSMSLVV